MHMDFWNRVDSELKQKAFGRQYGFFVIASCKKFVNGVSLRYCEAFVNRVFTKFEPRKRSGGIKNEAQKDLGFGPGCFDGVHRVRRLRQR